MIRIFLCLLLLTFYVAPVTATQFSDNTQTLGELIESTTHADPIGDITKSLELPEIRMEAIREAALSYGARGGLAKRTSQIRESLVNKASSMDRIYDFKRLLIPAPSGLLIEPPILSEGENATLIETGGQSAVVADRIFNISREAQIVSSPRNWRAYLEREWGIIGKPHDILLPRTPSEKKEWVKYLNKGWIEGVKQANEIFQADLNALVADYTGMIRYRKLLSQGVVSAPYALQIDRGVTGGGNEMRVGDRAIQITGPSVLRTEAFEWKPVSR